MAANNEVPIPTPHAGLDAAHVAILMCTKDGAAFLAEQLHSIAEQTHTNWSLIVSDDGSTDATLKHPRRFAEGSTQKTAIRSGPRQGVCANFLSLATDPGINADYFAFSDQDDIWYKNKLQRALAWLVTVPGDVPAVYCGRTELVSNDGRSYGLSPLFTRPIAFRNAIVQSLGGGNTMVFNAAAKRLLEAMGRLDVVLHDWWMYQLVSAVGGAVHYDPQPMLKYRQHPDNLIGSNRGWAARVVRLRMMLRGTLSRLEREERGRARAHPRAFDRAAKPRDARSCSLKRGRRRCCKRLYYLKQSGVYRQTLLGNIGLIVATILKRI